MVKLFSILFAFTHLWHLLMALWSHLETGCITFHLLNMLSISLKILQALDIGAPVMVTLLYRRPCILLALHRGGRVGVGGGGCGLLCAACSTCYDCKLKGQTNALSSTGDYCVQRIAQAQPGCFIVIII